LPPDVAALVDTVEPERTGLQLVNLSSSSTRRVVVQAGGFGTDRIDEVIATSTQSEYPGKPTAYSVSVPCPVTTTTAVGGPRVEVVLPPGRCIHLDLRLTLRAQRAAHLTI
jgi:hypothetical protein